MTVSHLKGLFRIGIPLILAAFFAFAPTQTAEAGYYRYYSGLYSPYGLYGYGRGYYRHGYDPYGRHYYGSYSHHPTPGGLELGVARLAGLGALDLHVKPRRGTKVYLGGQNIGAVAKYDGYPSYLWLEEGTHQLVFYREGYETVTREFTIRPGMVLEVELRMERGQSVPPEEFLAELARDDAGNGLESG